MQRACIVWPFDIIGNICKLNIDTNQPTGSRILMMLVCLYAHPADTEHSYHSFPICVRLMTENPILTLFLTLLAPLTNSRSNICSLSY